MARLCIRVKPNDHPTNPALTPLRTRPGDVVCVVDDGHVFSVAERTNGHYRIIDVPGVSQEQLLDLVESVFDGNGNMTKRRNLRLDPTMLSNVAWVGKTSATKTQIDAIKIAVP